MKNVFYKIASIVLVICLLMCQNKDAYGKTGEKLGKQEKDIVNINDSAKRIVDEKIYIVKSKRKKDYGSIKRKFLSDKKIYHRHSKKDDNYFQQDLLMTVSLSDAELNQLKKQDNILIEEDYALSGLSDNNLVKEVEPDISIDELKHSSQKEYSDNPYEFVPCSSMIGKNKNSEILPWNIKCVVGDPKRNKYKGKGIKVAVIDSGIDVHDDLNTLGWVDFSDTVKGYKPIDNNGHGTNVAGIIGARINGIGTIGISSEAELYSVKVLDADNKASVSLIVKAIEWCIENDIDIINMSFGLNENSKILRECIKKAYENGILLIAAAGNESEIQYPAKYDEVISVGSINENLELSDFSAGGTNVELVAPGENAQTLGYMGTYTICDGTSISAAHVTGVAAAVKSMNKNLNNEQIRHILKNSSASIAVRKGETMNLINYGNAILYYKLNRKAVKSLDENKNKKVGKKVEDIHIDISEKEYVKGSWSSDTWKSVSRAEGTGHYSMINSLDTKYLNIGTNNDYTKQVHNKWIVGDSAYLTDKIDRLSAKTKDSPYHAKTIYSFATLTGSHLSFLYELARRRLVLGSQLDLNAANYNSKNNYYNVTIDLTTKRRIIDDLNVLYNDLVSHYRGTVEMSSATHRGYMVLGVYLHLLTDMYCHRAAITPQMIWSGEDDTSIYIYDYVNWGSTNSDSKINYNHFIRDGFWLCYFKIKEQGSIPMIRLKDVIKTGFSVSIPTNTGTLNYAVNSDNKAGLYEDNPFFYTNRYAASKYATENMITYMLEDRASTSKGMVYYVFDTWGVPLYTKSWQNSNWI